MASDDVETKGPKKTVEERLADIEALLHQIVDFLTAQQKQSQGGLGH